MGLVAFVEDKCPVAVCTLDQVFGCLVSGIRNDPSDAVYLAAADQPVAVVERYCVALGPVSGQLMAVVQCL